MFIKALIAIGLAIGGWFGIHEAPKFGASQTISSLTAKTSLSGDDTFVIVDNSGAATTKKITVTNATSSMKAYNDLQYSAIFSTSAGLAALLSDETGSGGGFVRATAPTISAAVLTSSPTLTTPVINVGSDATGDLYYRSAGGLFTRLGIGASGQYLYASTSGLVEWDNSHLLTNPQTASSTFTATTSFSGVIISNKFGGDGSDGALSITSGTRSEERRVGKECRL